ncbi:Rv3235 family protein [Brachybacterium sp. DNPG3]
MSTTDQQPLPSGQEDLRSEDPRAVARMIEPVARCAVEIVRDMRPDNALTRLVTPEVALMLSRRASLTRRLRATTGYAPPKQLQVSGVRTCIVNARTVEASCVLREPDRARFLAMRWELRHTGWKITVLEIG